MPKAAHIVVSLEQDGHKRMTVATETETRSVSESTAAPPAAATAGEDEDCLLLGARVFAEASGVVIRHAKNSIVEGLLSLPELCKSLPLPWFCGCLQFSRPCETYSLCRDSRPAVEPIQDEDENDDDDSTTDTPPPPRMSSGPSLEQQFEALSSLPRAADQYCLASGECLPSRQAHGALERHSSIRCHYEVLNGIADLGDVPLRQRYSAIRTEELRQVESEEARRSSQGGNADGCLVAWRAAVKQTSARISEWFLGTSRLL
mmetsp:Transcript_17712/g.41175  ORF Transcript_17712/g.41175 Transcript_17712/m.41175 type:complete len:261 (+) Transcript_17712:106-888(+)